MYVLREETHRKSNQKGMRVATLDAACVMLRNQHSFFLKLRSHGTVLSLGIT